MKTKSFDVYSQQNVNNIQKIDLAFRNSEVPHLPDGFGQSNGMIGLSQLYGNEGNELNDDMSGMFSSPHRTGDGCNPFKRFQHCNEEY